MPGGESVVEAIASGDDRAVLIALRDKVAKAIDDCDNGTKIAALTRRLQEIMRQLDGAKTVHVDESKPRSMRDELAARRETRRSGVPPRSRGRVKRGAGGS